MRGISVAILVACSGEGSDKGGHKSHDPDAVTDGGDADADADADTDTDTDADTDTVETTLPDPCEPAEAMQITELSTSQPWHENELLVELSLSMPSAVAVRCALRDDPAEVHLAEEAEALSDHEIRISGLLADADYDCLAAALCPATVEPYAFSVTTGPSAPGFVDLETEDYGGAGNEYVLFNQSGDCNYQYQRLNVVDREGRFRWWYNTPEWVGPSVEFRYHGNNQFQWGGGWDPNPLGRPRQVDLFDGEIYDSADDLPDAEDSDFHHDGKQLPDGRLLTLERVTVETGGWDSFDGFRVRRVDPATGVVDFDFHSQVAYDEGWLPRGYSYDPWHANWVDIVDETLYVSLCEISRIIAIDVATGSLVWTFGEDGDFSLTDAYGDPLDDGFTECQHGLEYTSDDRLLVYDNGWNRGYTRVSEYQLDPANLTAEMLWTWTEDDWWETTLGDADYLPNGRILVGAGHSDCFSSNPGDRVTLLEIDPATGDKLWQLRYIDQSVTAYRADWADACDLFANAAYCPAVADRLEVLEAVFSP